MDPNSIAHCITTSFPGIAPVAAWGETSFFYNPGRALPRGVYFATLKENDGDNDRASALDRPSVYRLNMGVSKASFKKRFGPLPSRPPAGGIVATGHDFTVLNELMPHPVYGWMAWVCVLNPSPATFEQIQPLLAEAHALAVAKFLKRVPAP